MGEFKSKVSSNEDYSKGGIAKSKKKSEKQVCSFTSATYLEQ